MDVTSFDFTLLSTTGILLCIVYFCAGIVDAVCGGGGLFTVPALMSIGMPPHMVVGTNQCSLVLGNVTAILKYSKNGKLDFRVSAIALPFTLVGAFIGARLNLLVSERYLQIIMIVLLPILAVMSLTRKELGNEDHSDEVPKNRQALYAALIGFFVSVYHAFYGPASGLFFMALFAVVMKYDVLNANGISKALLFVACLISGVTYAVSGNVQWEIVIPVSVLYIAGNYVGSTIALTKGAKIVKPAFYSMLAILFIKLIFDYFVN